jgi:hypothetical protein
MLFSQVIGEERKNLVSYFKLLLNHLNVKDLQKDKENKHNKESQYLQDNDRSLFLILFISTFKNAYVLS